MFGHDKLLCNTFRLRQLRSIIVGNMLTHLCASGIPIAAIARWMARIV
ncbi:Hypothetical protein ETEE_3156 [Edwardsiella anguillarum ET080813]|uniref:Uncharacterized protein n=1 Tax=Edwardsiella anguillarum ET080813 TaxID=667120 RepID=A0A076LVN4_9GAMM|nr:Hypothetical protein ETEE_3156 [Edwardsiella anguillarum ET080813]